MNHRALRVVAFVLLAISILLRRFTPEDWTWAPVVAGIVVVVALVAMVASFILGRRARRADGLAPQ